MSPATLLNTISLYEADKDKKRLVETVLQGMRENKIDIKKWQLTQVGLFIKEVARFEPKDLKTFYNYIELAFDMQFFKITRQNFNETSEIFQTFVDHGFLHSKSRTKFYFSYLVAIKEMLYPSVSRENKTKQLDEEKIQKDSTGLKGKTIDNSHIIPVVWSLILTEN